MLYDSKIPSTAPTSTDSTSPSVGEANLCQSGKAKKPSLDEMIAKARLETPPTGGGTTSDDARVHDLSDTMSGFRTDQGR